MALCTDDVNTPVPWYNALKIIVEVLLSVLQVSSNVSPERMWEVHFCFLCHKEPVI